MGADTLLSEPFRIGDRIVRPDRLEIAHAGRIERVEAKVMNVLLVLAARQGEVVTRDQLIAAAWNGLVASDESLSRAVSLLRLALGDRNGQHRHIRTVPKKGYQLVASVGPAPDRTTLSGDTGTGQANWSIPSWTPQAIIGVCMFSLLLASLVLTRQSDRGETSGIAVGLVEIDETETAGEPLLGSLLEDDLAGRLAAIGMTARVASPSVNPRPVAEFAVAMSARPDGTAARMQLVVSHPASGLTIWSRQLDPPIEELERHARIAISDLVLAFKCVVDMREMSDPAYLSHLFRVCDAFAAWDAPAMLAHSEAFEAFASDSAPAKAFLAYSSMINSRHAAPARRAELIDVAKREAAAALAVQPDIAIAEEALAMSLPDVGAFAERGRRLERALEMESPSPMLRYWLGALYYATGRIDEAFDMARLAIAYAPEAEAGHVLLTELTARHGDLGEALAMAGALAGRFPHSRQIVWFAEIQPAFWTTIRGDRQAAEAAAESFAANPRIAECSRLSIRAKHDGSPSVDDVLAVCSETQPASVLALIAVILGDLDRAYDLHNDIEIDPIQGEASVFWLFTPEYAAFRADPRFMPLAHRFGLAEYWLETGVWPDFCRRDALPYHCEAEVRQLVAERR